MSYQNNRNTCSCTGESRCNTCPYGRTPWGTREGCGSGCGRRPWNSRSTCSACERNTRNTCPCAANTTWRSRDNSCSCGTARTGSCSCENTARIGACGCNQTRETRSSCSCAEARRDGDCDTDCNHGARNTGILDGKSLAMVYSPYQSFDSLYDPRQGLCNGTIFTGLDKPFYGDRRGC